MKRCPECRRDYYDDTLSYCLADGAELVHGLGNDDPATAILNTADATGEAPTRAQIDTTAPTAVVTGTGVKSGARKTFDKRLLVAVLASACVVLVPVAVYRYFGSAATHGSINSIAVLPFENLSGSTDADYLSDGLTDSLIFRFSQLPALKVSPTSSVMRYKGKGAGIAEIAKALDVDGVLSGRLMRAGDSLSISVQLIDARNEKVVWAEQYDRKMTDLLATQREIATTLTQKMQLRLAGDERGITKKYTSSSEAYQLYMKGRFHYAKRVKDDMLKAIENYKQAIELDPNFALAYAATAEAYNSMGKNPDLPPKDCIPRAKEAAIRALELDPDLAQAHSALADSLAIYDWNWTESDKHFKRAIELDPNIAYTYVAYALASRLAAGETSEAASNLERAVEMEPLSLINNAVLTTGYISARQYDKAMVQAKSAYELDPAFPLARHWLGMAYIVNGRYDDAVALGKQIRPDSPWGWVSVVTIAQAHASSGDRVNAEKEIAIIRELAKTRYVRPYYLASIYAALGDKDQAFSELERSFEEKDLYLGRIVSDPFIDPLRGDRRYKDLLIRMNLTE
jgi:eukaryotic-like serine/threonine-protein kinase